MEDCWYFLARVTLEALILELFLYLVRRTISRAHDHHDLLFWYVRDYV